MHDGRQPGSLQKKMFKGSGQINDTGDKYIADLRKLLFNSGSGADGTISDSDKTEMFF